MVSMLHAVVCPKQKKVKIMIGKKVVKIYTFKMDIPFTKVQKTVWLTDYSAWSVSDRDYEDVRETTEWDRTIMQSVRDKALAHYKSQNK